MPLEKVLGVVLAGGASRRMGFDKRGLELEGRTLVERAAAVLEPVCAEVVVSMQPEAPWRSGSLRTIHDLRLRCGPLAGLEAALEEAVISGRSTFLLACDLPNVGTGVVRHLLDRARNSSEYAAVVPRIADRRQPLCALYRRTALATVRQHLDAGRRSMRDLLEALPVLGVEIRPDQPFCREDLFHNLNEPEDLAGVLPVE